MYTYIIYACYHVCEVNMRDMHQNIPGNWEWCGSQKGSKSSGVLKNHWGMRHQHSTHSQNERACTDVTSLSECYSKEHRMPLDKSLKYISRQSGHHLQAPPLFQLQRPGSAVLSHWCQCLPVAWSPVRQNVVDEWFQRHLPGGSTRRRAARMTCLPAAGSDPRLEIEVSEDRQRSLLLSWRSS